MFAIRRFAESPRFVLAAGKIGQGLGYLVACLVFVCGLVKLSALELADADRFFGVLLVSAVSLLLVCLGTITRIEAELTARGPNR